MLINTVIHTTLYNLVKKINDVKRCWKCQVIVLLQFTNASKQTEKAHKANFLNEKALQRERERDFLSIPQHNIFEHRVHMSTT